MKPGDILLFKAEQDFVSRLITWGAGSKYSHIAVCVSPKMNLAIETIARGGIRARDIRKSHAIMFYTGLKKVIHTELIT